MRRALLAVALAACGSPATPAVNPAMMEAQKRVEAATAIVRNLRSEGDGAIPIAIAHGARCVAIVPALLHAGLVLGARAGRGIVTCANAEEWTTPAFFELSGATAGLAAGAERVDLVMLVMTRAGEDAVLSGHLRIGADTSITAGPIGRSVQVATDVLLATPILYYSRSNGLFVGLDLSGTRLERDEEAMRAFYGDKRDFGVLLHPPRPEPPEIETFRAEVAQTFRR
jgi:lipid-binding SYLF domain-containing protein